MVPPLRCSITASVRLVDGVYVLVLSRELSGWLLEVGGYSVVAGDGHYSDYVGFQRGKEPATEKTLSYMQTKYMFFILNCIVQYLHLKINDMVLLENHIKRIVCVKKMGISNI